MNEDFAYDALRHLDGLQEQMAHKSVFVRLAQGHPLPDGVTIKRGRWSWKPMAVRKRIKKKTK